MTMGAAVAVGVGVGTALFAATGDAFWIAIGAGIGTALGAGAHGVRGRD